MHHATFSIEVILYLIPFCLGRDCLKALWGLEIEGEGLMWWGSPSVGDGTGHTPCFCSLSTRPNCHFRKSVVKLVDFLTMMAIVVVVLHLTSSEHVLSLILEWRNLVF